MANRLGYPGGHGEAPETVRKCATWHHTAGGG
ncbi:hypothetical protein PC128_g1615 [Phytophthora cactorum]|nr:hypothetical protein PC128_g1615 [Phytophthora cactorum]KAG4059044.1 hypothetical protein PC123_g5992 [Phytophthora cactorum]